MNSISIILLIFILLFLSNKFFYKNSNIVNKNSNIVNKNNNIVNKNSNIVNKNRYNKNKKPIEFYKCDKFVIGKIVKTVLSDNNILRNKNIHGDWTLFLPCTYNNIETELINIEKNLEDVKNSKNNNKQKLLFGIHGCDFIVSKNNLWKLLEEKYGRNNAKKLMPETWILSNEDHMKVFKENFSDKKMYIMKKNIQRKLGLHMTNKLEEIINNDDKKFRVVQKYMKNTYMINKRKINLRIYLLIVYKNGRLTSYYYKNGKCIYTNKDSTGSNNLEENITSLNLDMDIYKKNPFDLFELAQYMDNKDYVLLITNIINNLKKLEYSYKKLLLEKNKSTKNKKNIYFQLFGLDYIFDNNFNAYLLEINKGPDMSSKNDKDFLLKYRIYEDLFDKMGIIESKKNNMFINIH